MALLRDKRLLLVGVLIGGIAATFWASSRIPSLEGKAAVGRELALEDPLGFEPVVWEKELVHTYQNDGEERATLFCCDCPPFVPSDEIVVGEDLGANMQPLNSFFILFWDQFSC